MCPRPGGTAEAYQNCRYPILVELRYLSSRRIGGGRAAGTAIMLAVVFPLLLTHAGRVVYLDSGIVRVGIDLERGGSIGYLAASGTPSNNVINCHDMGREVQLSFYSGPKFYNPPTHQYPNGACDRLFRGQQWPWNPIGAGDVDGNRGRILNVTQTNESAYLLTRPLQWACHDVPCDCTFEQTFSVATPAGTGVKVDNVLHTARVDTTEYPPYDQELPAVYSNAPFYRLITYNGTMPFTADVIVEYSTGWDDAAAFPWLPGKFPATESWAAMVNKDGWGVGIVAPISTTFVAGFNGRKGPGGPEDVSTGYVAPTKQVSIPARGDFKFTFYLVLGDVATIRSFAWQVQGHGLADTNVHARDLTSKEHAR